VDRSARIRETSGGLRNVVENGMITRAELP
jgi:hypothetical protein